MSELAQQVIDHFNDNLRVVLCKHYRHGHLVLVEGEELVDAVGRIRHYLTELLGDSWTKEAAARVLREVNERVLQRSRPQ